MGLLGTFGATDGTGALTTGSRTSVAGSLIVAHMATWATTSGNTLPVPTSSLGGTFSAVTQVGNGAVGSFLDVGLSYNFSGPRGASNTLSMTDINVQSMTGSEFDGIGGKVATQTATGNSAAPAITITAPWPALIVAIQAPDFGLGQTMAVSAGSASAGWVELIEADEDNTNQAHAVAYIWNVTGSQTMTWDNSASGNWACAAIAFSLITGTPKFNYDKFPKFLLRSEPLARS
jgi:hypothetical protein